MHFTSYLENGCLTIALTGEIDHHSAKEYIHVISGKIEAYTPRECTLDFSQVSFMDSSGIAVIINSLRSMSKMQGSLYVSDLRPQPRKVFSASGIDKLVQVKEYNHEI